jgi:Family of unknown function (DUF6365)
MENGKHKHLILSLGRKGLGEAALGLRLAAELRQSGDEVFFLAHESNSKLLGGFPHQTISTAISPLLQLYVQAQLAGSKISSIILADYYITTLFFALTGLGPEILTSSGLPIFAIDTWDSTKTPAEIDVLLSDTRHLTKWPGLLRSIYPVPFLHPEDTGSCYASLPEEISVPRKIRRHIRHTLGLSDTSRGIVFCTAEWQHPNYDSEQDVARRFAASLPALIADYVLRLGKDIHLIHIGPCAYNLKGSLNGHYHWLPPLPPGEFDPLLASMDLLLSANVSATTIAKAMVSGIPVLLLQNSIAAANREEAEAAMVRPATPRLADWLEQSTPIYPFSMWPLGYYRFLAPILKNNPYMNSLDVAELLDEQQVEASITSLLFDQNARDSQRHRQAAYLEQVRQLPTGAQLIQAALT